MLICINSSYDFSEHDCRFGQVRLDRIKSDTLLAYLVYQEHVSRSQLRMSHHHVAIDWIFEISAVRPKVIRRNDVKNVVLSVVGKNVSVATFNQKSTSALS